MRRRNGGFTLLEILVAVTVLAVAFSSIYRLFGGTIRSIMTSEGYVRAVVVGEQMMTEVLFDEKKEFEPGSSQGAFAGNPHYTYEMEIAEYETPIGRSGGDDTKDIKDKAATYVVNLKVKWKDGREQKSLLLSSMKTVVEESEL